MQTNQTSIEGLIEILPDLYQDQRGTFIKLFHAPTYHIENMHSDFPEEYYSISKKGVIRGMHFQLPPDDHIKLVCCQYGEVIDVVLDLRVGSRTYGKFQEFVLSGKKANMLLIPKGFAHGFCSMKDDSIVMYKVSTVYSPKHDASIRWDSFGYEWPCEHPILSERDKAAPTFSEFVSPFRFLS